jgi:hypothetical protein
MTAATLTIGIDPTIQVGPVELAWHGIMTAVGLAIAISIARRHGSAAPGAAATPAPDSGRDGLGRRRDLRARASGDVHLAV